jgi:hypothetical protein
VLQHLLEERVRERFVLIGEPGVGNAHVAIDELLLPVYQRHQRDGHLQQASSQPREAVERFFRNDFQQACFLELG